MLLKTGFVLTGFFILLSTAEAKAAQVTVARPARRVFVKPMGTIPFQLPNGVPVNLGADLDALLRTAVTSTPSFSPTDGPDAELDPCGNYIEIRSNLSTFELNLTQFGVSVGYSPGGTLGDIAKLTGAVDVSIGTIAMDFSVWECVNGQCSSVAATMSDHLTAKVGLKFQIDLKAIKISPDFVFNTPIASIIRQIMDDGLSKLAKTERLNELTWRATVKQYVPEIGMVVFDAGTQSRIKPNQGFVVYAVTPDSGVCDLFRAIAYVKTTRVDAVSSVGMLTESLDHRQIEIGDQVMVRSIIK